MNTEMSEAILKFSWKTQHCLFLFVSFKYPRGVVIFLTPTLSSINLTNVNSVYVISFEVFEA